ncbi:alpha-terpineol synthase, chloroplastic-like [Tasmannia lanceolata]|uniref:alpha-terpineol synthase, chloroplastic-like n=1 Tax=Tasmannia lanceolata TaxID=3420 RepID=UPI004063BC85
MDFVSCISGCPSTPSSSDNGKEEVIRRSADYLPSVWGDHFLTYSLSEECEIHATRVEKLKEDVRKPLEEANDPLALLELINALQRLGVGYLFDKEIKGALHTIFVSTNNNKGIQGDLYSTALRFRLLRKHGYEISQDVFKRFKDKMGRFKSSLCQDGKGMLSLYEASYLAFEGESILDEAKAFTIRHLKNLKGKMDLTLSNQVEHALKLPSHWRILRLEAKWYIDAYEKEELTNPILLELAKLDFNNLQTIHQRDLKETSRWWRDLNLRDKLPFVRDRVVECFFWSLGVMFEPQYQYCRKELTKINQFIVIIDDIYDVYGSLDELELFTDAIDRWDVNAIGKLPDYMKICFLALFNTVNEIAYGTLKEQGWDIIPNLKKVWADLCKSFLVEAKWYNDKYVPTFEEYLNNAWISMSAPLALVHIYFLLGNKIQREALESLEKYPNFIRWSSLICRLCNDLVSSKVEMERGDVSSSIQCYMHETGVSEEIARKHMRALINDLWKKMNKDCAALSSFPQAFIDATVNLTRTAQCVYQYGDGFSDPNCKTKDRIKSLLVQSIPLKER